MICRNSSDVLLITGCITPYKDVHMLVLTDSIERRKQYIDSIKFYITHSKIKRIIYCDNSAAKSEEELFDLADSKGKKFEWISFSGESERILKQGKGYGETEIIRYALEHSELITEDDYLIKVTGRLIVKNINFLLKMSNRKSILVAPNRIRDGRFYVNTRLYMMPIKLYKKFFLNLENMVNDSDNIYLEHAFAMCIREANLKYKKLYIAPWIEGVSGSTGRLYKPSLHSYMRECVKLWLYKEGR